MPLVDMSTSNAPTITTGTIEEAVAISQQIPEFQYAPLTAEAEIQLYQNRMQNKVHLILIAWVNGQPAGFKAGYQRYNNRTFYSFMGAVLPQYRRMGIARALAKEQEKWAKQNGYTRLVFKTRNRFANMLLFAIGNGFKIVKVKPAQTLANYRIHLQKRLR